MTAGRAARSIPCTVTGRKPLSEAERHACHDLPVSSSTDSLAAALAGETVAKIV
jgi:hypothetical protein